MNVEMEFRRRSFGMDKLSLGFMFMRMKVGFRKVRASRAIIFKWLLTIKNIRK